MRAASIGPVLCIVLGAMLAPVVSRAQDPVHRRYTMSDGLPSDHIYSVTQDRNGFIWFGTDAGASRFDGTSFTNFSLEDGLPDHEVLNIAEDSQGRIWFMLLSGKLCYWKDGELHHEGTDPGLRYDKVTSGWQTMGEDDQGRIWFGGVYGTLIRLDREARVDSVFDRSRPSFSGPGFIFSIVRDENGRMLIFQGPVMSVPRGDSLVTVPVEHQVVHLGMVMSAARPGRPALALTPQGISTFRADGKCTDIPIPVRFDPTIGRRCWEDREGNIWVQRRMNGIGLLVREGSGFRYRSLFEADRVNHALVDREGERWLCTDKGVVRFNQDQERSRSYTAPGNEGFLSLHVTDAGRIYAGGEEKGLYVLQDDRLMPFHLPADQLGPGRVLGMETDREGGLWIGTDFSLYHMDPRGVVGVVPYDFRKAEVRARDRMGVRSVTVGADGKVFTGGVGVQEVFPYGKGFMRVHHLWKHTKHHRVNEIHRDARGRVWYANGEWLHVLTGDSIRTIPIKQFTSGKRISDIAELGRDTILVATSGGGMVLLDTAVRPHRLVGLSDRAGDIRRIRVHEGRIWTATADGVYIHVLEGLELEEQLHIRGSHGLISADCRDVWPLRTGALVATSKGITLFDHLPEPRKGSGPLSLYFPSITCDDSVVSAFDTIRLVTGRTVLSVTVRQVGFIDEGKGEYEWRPSEKDPWRPVIDGRINQVDHRTGLHTWEVRGRRGGEAWTVRNALVVLSTPPWYQTFWARSTFVLLGAMLLIGLGVLFQRIKQGSELRRLSTLQRLSEERRRIAADVHDDLGADLSHLLGQARMVQAGNAGIEQLTEGIGRSMDKIDDIIWSLDPERDTVRSTADFIETWTRNYAHAHGLDFRSGIKVSAHEPTIRADQRRELALVMKEAMRNVVKHAKARSIHLSVIMETGRMKLVLQDDGEVSPIGRTSERRSGSANMARRVERLGGRSYFEPVAPRGTRFIVELDLEGRPKE